MREGVSERIPNLDALPLERVCAHDGVGQIDFVRVFDSDAFRGPWNFVDYAVIPPGASIGRHTHGDDEEIYLVLEGSGEMFVDGKTFRVGAGDVIRNRPGGTHGLRNDTDRPLRIFVVEVALGTRSDE